MIPAWEKALAHAATLLSESGQMHIVDFGPCEGLPSLARRGLYAWLKAFHVTPRTGLQDIATAVAASSGCAAEVWTSHRGYAVHARLTKLV
jgi:S-adenosylmethionine-diacylgycerolhomoserine-N-methlytransferase